MADNDQYLIPSPAAPEPTQLSQHVRDQRRANTAIVIACVAAAFAAWQAYEARQARLDAKQAALDQRADVERARRAAEDSAAAAKLLAQVGQQSLAISDRGALAAERSARAAERSLTTSKELFAEGRRAEISRVTTVMKQFEADKPIKYEVHFMNAGHSRASNVITVTSPLTLSVDQPFPSDPLYNLQDRPSASVVLAGEKIVQYGEGSVIARPVIDAVAAGKMRLYVHGKVTYTDADGRSHTTTFCDYYKIGSPTMTACSGYNAIN